MKLLSLHKMLATSLLLAGVLISCDKGTKINEDGSINVVRNGKTGYSIVYNKETTVMYAVSSGTYDRGTFTMLCDKDGKPQSWGGNNNE